MTDAFISTVSLEPPAKIEIPPGATVAEIVEAAKIPEAALPFVCIMLNGVEVARDEWDTVHAMEDDTIAVLVVPAGNDGKSIMRLVATIAVAIAAPYAAAGLGFTTTTATGATVLSAGGQAVAAGITLVGTLAVNALIPPPSARIAGGDPAGNSYFFQNSQNNFRPYQIVPKVYGTHKMYAAMASHPLIFSAGTKSLYTGLYDWGLGAVNLYDLKIGDTPRSVAGGRTAHWQQYPKLKNEANPSQGYQPIPLTLMTVPLAHTQTTYGLNDLGDDGVVTTRPDSARAIIEVLFPQGLVRFNREGEEGISIVDFQVEWREAGQTGWQRSQTYVYGGDHLRAEGYVNQPPGALPPGSTPDEIPPDPNDPLATHAEIWIDPYDGTVNEAPREGAGQNVMLRQGSRLHVRFRFDRPVYGFDPTQHIKASGTWGKTETLPWTVDTTPINPQGKPTTAQGVIILDAASPGAPGNLEDDVTMFEVELVPVANRNLTGPQKIQVYMQDLYDKPATDPTRKPLAAALFSSDEGFSVDTVTLTDAPADPPPTDDGTSPDVYSRTTPKTYFMMLEVRMDAGASSSWIAALDAGNELWTNDRQRAITQDMQFYVDRRGRRMDYDLESYNPAYNAYTRWSWWSVKSEYV